MSKELKVAIKVVKKAGKLVMDFYNKQNYKVETKGGYYENFVTDADKQAEILIIEELKKHFPNHGFRAEEFNTTQSDKKSVWIIDPVDGTRNFVKRDGEFAVMIGLSVKGTAQLGVVLVPDKNMLYYAERGKGAYKNDVKIQVSNNGYDNMRAAVNRNIKHDKEIQKINEKVPFKLFNRIGSIGYKICLVAEGEYDAFLSKLGYGKEWDLCAPSIILQEAGGKITLQNGEIPTYNRKEEGYSLPIISSNGKVHQQILDKLNS